MTPEEYTSYYPAELSIGSHPPVVYQLSTQRCANLVCGSGTSEEVTLLNDGEQSYKLSELDLSQDVSTWLPVYENGAEVSIPTGRLYLQLQPGQDVRSIETRLNELEYKITAVPSYAKHTAWLEREDNDIGRALHGVGAIVEHINPVNVEAQLLRPSAVKSR